MIHPLDTLTLALTKLRTRKVRLSLTVIISGLLFSILIGASIIISGAFDSINRFTKEGFGERYIVQTFPLSDSGQLFTDPQVIERATALYNDLVARKKAEAKKLGITYDPASEQRPYDEYDTPDGKQKSLSYNSPLARQALKEQTKFAASNMPQQLKVVTAPYKPKGIYESRHYASADGSSLQVLKDGKEDFSDRAMGKFGGYYVEKGVDTFVQAWTAMSDNLLQPFILPHQTLTKGADDSLPIIVPYAAAETFLDLKPLTPSADSNQKLERMKYIRKHLAGVTFQVCYRNQTSGSLVAQARSVQDEIARNKNKKDYKKPDLIYGLPNEACTAAPVIRDVRSAEQKKLDAKQQQFDQLFGAEPATQSLLKFRVVGVTPDPPFGNATTVAQIVDTIVRSSLGSGWFMPTSVIQGNAVLEKVLPDGAANPYDYGTASYVELRTAAAEKKFLDKESCTDNNPVDCNAKGKYFYIQPFGSNSIALNELKARFDRYFNLIGLGIVLVAALIMMGTVGRMIADSRRETAVFRAIGAKRRDIVVIYVLYTLLLSLLVAGFAGLAGIGLASIANGQLSPALTVQSLVAYNSQDLTKTFTLFGFNASEMLRIFGFIILAGIISSIIPLLRNVRRNPIRDMRDDT